MIRDRHSPASSLLESSTTALTGRPFRTTIKPTRRSSLLGLGDGASELGQSLTQVKQLGLGCIHLIEVGLNIISIETNLDMLQQLPNLISLPPARPPQQISYPIWLLTNV